MKVAAVPLIATAVNKSLVLNIIKRRPKIENKTIISLPLKIFFFNKFKSDTISLEALDKVESRVEIAEINKSKKTIKDIFFPKLIPIALKKEIFDIEASDRKIPNKEKENIHAELNRNA